MPQPSAILVIDLAFGDCGKGTIVDYLTRRHDAKLVVRFNGGPQAAHNVIAPDGRHHTFSSFASGTLCPGVRTLLSRHVLIEPGEIFVEADRLTTIGVGDALQRLCIDARCPVITPVHQAANHLRELHRAEHCHGTCGFGVGELMLDVTHDGLPGATREPAPVITAGELGQRASLARKLRAIRDHRMDTMRDIIRDVADVPRASSGLHTLENVSWIPDTIDCYTDLARAGVVRSPEEVHALLRAALTTIFEGAQGVLLDEWFGFHPYTTWSTTTFANALDVLAESQSHASVTRLGVLRAYFTRHGAGPLVTEAPTLRPALPETHNADTGWPGAFRVGVFDAVAARYALDVVGGVDTIAMTHIDRLGALPGKVCSAYRVRGDAPDGLFTPEGRIHHNPDRDLSRQERLTRALSRCEPVWEPVGTEDPASFIATVERHLETTVGLLSTGPRAGDKAVRPG